MAADHRDPGAALSGVIVPEQPTQGWLNVCCARCVPPARIGISYAKFFGRRTLGSITGVTKACWQVATAIGPTPLGVVRDLSGSFLPALGGAALLCVVSAGLVWAGAKRPSAVAPQMMPCYRRERSTAAYGALDVEEGSSGDPAKVIDQQDTVTKAESP